MWDLIFPEEFDPIKIKRSYLFKALRRLDHEVMFLCIDVYSLYEGVQKKKSFYAREIKQHGKYLTKVDKSLIAPDTVNDSGISSSSGWRESSDEEKEEHRQFYSEEALRSWEEMRDNFGPKYHRHSEMDEWKDSWLDSGIVAKLQQYRKKFAYRLDSLDNFKEELKVNRQDSIKDMLNTVRDLLNRYKSRFQFSATQPRTITKE